MTLLHFLTVLRARWRFALAVFVATVAAAATVALLIPRTYTANASLLIDVSRPDPVTGVSNGGNPSPAIMATQVGVLKSDRVALEVVRNLGLAAQPQAREKWLAATRGQGDLSEWLVQRLQKTTEITPERDTNVVVISAKAATPELAAQVANAYARAYLEVSAAIRAEAAQDVSAFFTRRVKDSRADLERAQARLADFQRSNGVVVSDARLDSETARLDALSTQLTMAEGAAVQLPETQSSPLVASLRADLIRAETALQELTGRLDENHPQVIQARATVALLRDRLGAETRRISSTAGMVNSAQHQRASELRAALEAQRNRVLRMRTLQGDGGLLLRDVENAQRAYDGVQARLSQASLESHVMQGNASLLAPAMAPVTPSSPRRLVGLGLAGVLGVLFAGVAVVLLELADPRLRTDDAIVTELDQPLLGVLPRPGAAGSFRVRKIPLVGPSGRRRLAAPRQGASA